MAGVYIHVPFCHSKCAYCDFYSLTQTGYAQAYVNCLGAEWQMRRNEIADDIRTVYIGGGTPSCLAPDLLERLLSTAPFADTVEEFTVEVNPEDVSEHLCATLTNHGVNRVSMGVQSFVDSELTAISRRHSAVRAVEAYETLRKGGIGNISLDLIYGLPGQTLDTFRYSLDRLLDLRPEHFSAYILSYEPRTRLTAMLKSGKIQAADDELILDMYSLLTERAGQTGYEHYEISNFALPGKRSRHNSSYWDSTPYLGLGPGAHSFDGAVRRINPPSLQGYLECLSDGRSAFVVDEEDEDSRFNDIVITSLRTSEGLDLDSIPERRKNRLLDDAAGHIANGTLVNSGSRLLIPEAHWPVADSILVDLVQV